ncbi:MAG TPA: lantibiotic dehydratase, partial [Kofleriaceae bacterium]
LIRRAGEPSTKDTREKHELVAKYLIRYCLKNDTIGFFGPMGWGWIDPDADALTVEPGPGLLAQRFTRFEHWCIDTLAERLSADPRLLPWMPPRRLPFVRLEGTRLHPLMGAPVELGAASARALALSTGEHTARQVAAALQADPALGISSEAEALALLQEHKTRGWIRWALEVPNVEPYPERPLRRRLESIDDPALRAEALAPLDDLIAKRDAVARCAGDAEALARALDQLNEAFSTHTEARALRREGQTYAGRSLVYEDCRRDVALTFGPDLLRRIGPGLQLLLDSARWLTSQLGARYQATFEAAFDALRAAAPSMSLLPFHLGVSKHFPFTASRAGMYVTPEIARPIIAELQQRWATLLSISPDERRVQRSSADLAGAARELFGAPGPGWPTARYHAPDLMLAASSAEAIRRGDFLAVLGELHMGINTLESPGLFFLHPHQEDLVRALDSDLARPRLAPTVPKDRATRSTIVPFTSRSIEFAYDMSPSWRPPSSVLAASELVVERVDGALAVRSRDGTFCVHILEFYDWLLSFQFTNSLKLLPPRPHTPRVTIDNVVLCHETWRFATKDLPFLHLKDPTERYIAARRWARDHGLPERVFFRASSERKPFFFDLTSPILLKVFSKMAKASEEITLAEALPDVGALWLVDRQGRSYTSELRMVMVDDQAFAVRPPT